MKRLKKRLERLEAAAGSDTREKDKPDSPLRAAALQFSAVLNERQFQDWRKSRLTAGLPADREIYDAKKAEEKAAESAAWQAHLETLSADERARINASPIAEAGARFYWERGRRRRGK